MLLHPVSARTEAVRLIESSGSDVASGSATSRAGGHEDALTALGDPASARADFQRLRAPKDCFESLDKKIAEDQFIPFQDIARIHVSVPVDVHNVACDAAHSLRTVWSLSSKMFEKRRRHFVKAVFPKLVQQLQADSGDGAGERIVA